jgi:hypothetical protein
VGGKEGYTDNTCAVKASECEEKERKAGLRTKMGIRTNER